LTAEGEFAQVREHLEAALPKPSIGWIAFGDHEVYNLLTDTAARQRDLAAIQKYAHLAEELALRYDHKLNQAIAHRAWGVAHHLAGEYAEAQLRLNQALEIFQQLETRWQIGRTLFELGELASTQLETSNARHYFARALSVFEIVGALPDVARTREKLELL
jgi:tetratricopeptide (TPR) repeat protein